MPVQRDKVINVIRGKNLTGHADKDDIDILLDHIDSLERWLDEKEEDDFFGTEGWRHCVGLD